MACASKRGAARALHSAHALEVQELRRLLLRLPARFPSQAYSGVMLAASPQDLEFKCLTSVCPATIKRAFDR